MHLLTFPPDIHTMSTRKNAEFQSVGPSEAVRRRLSSVSADSKPAVVAGFTSLTVSNRSLVSREH